MKRLIAGTLLTALLTSSAGAISDPELAGMSTSESTQPTQEPTVAASSATAYPATMTVKLDGKRVKPVGYNIKGNNYYKLRDIAQILDGTTAKFDISWNEEDRVMDLFPGETYMPVGGELGEIPTKNKTAKPSTETVKVNDQIAPLAAYNVDGYNYFKLVDLGTTLGFSVDYDSKTRTVVMTTPEPPEETQPPENQSPPEEQQPEQKPNDPESSQQPGDTQENPDNNQNSGNAEDPNDNQDNQNAGNTETDVPQTPVSAIDGKLKIWIDPGHGGSDSGNVATSSIPFDDYWGVHHDGNTKIYEKDFNLAVSLILQDKLEDAGVEVRMTRTDDSTVTPSQRETLFSTEGGGYDMIFSVHHNGYSNSTPKGAELLIQIAYENGGIGQEFGELLKSEYETMGQSWRRFLFQHSTSNPNKDYYFVLRSAAQGGALAFISEFCFMSNPDDQLWILYPENLEKQAQAQYNAIMEYFKTHAY